MKKVCILYSNAGAGHRTVAKALEAEFKTHNDIQIELVNFAEAYKVKGYDTPGTNYKFMLKYFAWFYGVIVWIVNQTLPLWFLRTTYKKSAESSFKLFMQEHDADIYLSTYYFDYALYEYIKANYPKKKTIMLVTDIVFALRIWFNPAVDQIIVPTKEIYANGLKYFKEYAAKVKIMGLPIPAAYFAPHNQKALKLKLGLKTNTSILVFGGGEGLNSIPAIVKAIDNANSEIDIVVVCGKDKTQQSSLESQQYKNNVVILGWIENFPEYVLACDLIVSKAGPTTIWECLTAKKPMLIFSYIRGQESGNIEFAQNNGDVHYAPALKTIANLPLIKSDQRKKDLLENLYFSTNWSKAITQSILN